MIKPSLIIQQAEHDRLGEVCASLLRQVHARTVLLLERSGQFITRHGDLGGADMTALASLAAGNVAATSAMAELVGEGQFPSIVHEGEQVKLHMSLVGHNAILVVVFDLQSSLGWVRLRAKHAVSELETILATVETWTRSQGSSQVSESSPDLDGQRG